MPLGLFACRHAAGAATDGGRWTPVLRLGGSRSLISIARTAARACRRSGSSKIGRESACSVGSAHEAAARGLSSSCRRHGSRSESESLELRVATDPSSEEDEDGEEGAHCCCRGCVKRARHLAAKSSDAIYGRYGWRDPSSATRACCSSRGRVSSSSSVRHSISNSGEEPSRGVWGGRSEDVVRCRFSPNGCFLAACTSSGALRVYEVETGQQVCNIPYAHAGGINDICWHHSSGYIFTASSDGSAALFPLTFRTKGGAARRLLRSSGRTAAGLSSSSVQLPLHVENAVAPLLEFFPRAAAAAASAPGAPPAATGAGKGTGSAAAGSAGSTLSAAASARHRNLSSSSMAGVAVAPVTCVAAPQSSSAASSVHCMYTGSYDEFVRSWDMRASRGPLLQVRAHDGPVTSLEFAEASPLLLPPYIPSRTAFPSQYFLFSLMSHNEDSCCYCRSCSSPCRCCCGPCCGCEFASCGSYCCCHSFGAGGDKGGVACTGVEVAVASAAAALGGSCSRRRPLFSSAAAAGAAVSLPDMLASASVDGLVRLWQAPALKLLRTTRCGRGGWEGGSSGATAASPSAATATMGSSGIGSVGCGSPAAAAAAATAGCCHVTWSRSGNFLLCLYEQGLGGGTVLRLRTLRQPLERRITRRQQQLRQQQQERQGEGGKRSRLNGEAEGRMVAAGTGEDQNTQQGDEFAEESEEEEEEEEDDDIAEEEKWWGQETCMPLPVPFMWDEIVQQELLESACKASWHPAPPSRHAAAAAGGGKAAAQPCSSGEGELAANAATPTDLKSSCCGSGTPQNARKRGACVLRTAADLAAAVPGCAGVVEGAAAAGASAAASAAWTAPAASPSGAAAATLYALLCRKEKIFSPFGTFWRDCAVLPGSDGCVRVFDALRGKLLHTLVPAADISSTIDSAVCTSVDAHPDWSVGVLASSCSAPDGAVVLWLWEGDSGDEGD